MKLVDANVLSYSVNEADPKHELARGWLDGTLARGETVGLALLVPLAFVRITTRIGLFPSPLATAEAVAVVHSWTSQPSAVVLELAPRHLEVLAAR